MHRTLMEIVLSKRRFINAFKFKITTLLSTDWRQKYHGAA